MDIREKARRAYTVVDTNDDAYRVVCFEEDEAVLHVENIEDGNEESWTLEDMASARFYELQEL
jgi:hypothetical protein